MRIHTVFAIIVLACGVVFYFRDALFGPYAYLDANPFHFDPWRTYAMESDLAHKTYRTDSFETYLPRRYELTRAIRSLRFPLWNPYIFGGMPFFADPQTRVLYPLSLVLVLFDPLRSMTYDVAIHIFLASIGMFLFARKLGISRIGSVLTSFAYSFSSYFYMRIGHSTFVAVGAWIPFLFYGYERARQAKERLGRIRSTLLLSVFLVLGYFAGFPQVYVFGVLSLLAYGFYLSVFEESSRRISNLLHTLKIFAISGAVAILVVCVQLIPFVELYRNSTGLRITLEDMTRFHVAPKFVLLKLIFPGLFGNPVEGTLWEHMTQSYFRPGLVHFTLFCGVGTIILAIISITGFYRDPRIQIFGFLLVGSTWVAVSPQLTALLYKISPIFRASRIERICVVSCFSMSVLAGLSFDRLAELGNDSKLRRRIIYAIAVVICFSLGVALFWQIWGFRILTGVAEGAKKTTADLWGKIHAYTRSAEVKRWIDGDIDAWLSYEKKQVARGLFFVVATALLLWILIVQRMASKRREIFRVILVGVVCLDIWLAARDYLVLQVSDCLFETQGMKILGDLLSGNEGWRLRTVHNPGEDIEVLPPNTNQIFKLQSLNGLCTIVPQGYTDLQLAYTEFRLPKLLQDREAPLSPGQVVISNLGCARYVLSGKQEKVFIPNPIFHLIGASQEMAKSIRILSLDGVSKIAFNQPEGHMLNVRIQTPKVRFLDLEFGFNSDQSVPGDTIVCLLSCKSGDSEVTLTKSFDVCMDKGRWHPIRIDISKIAGGGIQLRLGWAPKRVIKGTKVNAGWAGLNLVYDDCQFRKLEATRYVIEGDLGEAISLSIESNCKEVPLDVEVDSGTRRTLWVAFTDEMRSRDVTVDFNQPGIQEATIRSDSSFVLKRACSVYLAKVYQGFSLIYDKDMFIYENHNAVKRGICVDRGMLETRDGKVILSEIDNIGDIEFGKCSILRYEPERIELNVSSDRDCFLIFQDVWYPGWKAIVDGKEKVILPTDTGMRAIELNPGQHSVVMAYEPKSLKIGLLFSLTGIALALLLYCGYDFSPISKAWLRQPLGIAKAKPRSSTFG